MVSFTQNRDRHASFLRQCASSTRSAAVCRKTHRDVCSHHLSLPTFFPIGESFPSWFAPRMVTGQLFFFLFRNICLVYVRSWKCLDTNHMKIPRSQRARLLHKACFVESCGFHSVKKKKQLFLWLALSTEATWSHPFPCDSPNPKSRIRICHLISISNIKKETNLDRMASGVRWTPTWRCFRVRGLCPHSWGPSPWSPSCWIEQWPSEVSLSVQGSLTHPLIPHPVPQTASH